MAKRYPFELLRCVHSNTKTIPTFQIGQLGIGSKTVVAIDVDSSVLDALEKMSKYKVSSIAVIEAGFIFGNISMADIRVSILNTQLSLSSQPISSSFSKIIATIAYG